MKIQYLSMALLAISLAACTNDENDVLNTDQVAARITANIGNDVETRVVNNQWETGNLIGISYTTTDNNKSGTNISYKATSTDGDFEASDTPIYLEGSDTYTFNAYYPYNSGITTENSEITTTTTKDNQNTNIDFLYASDVTATKDNPKVNFTFKHCMSQLSLTFKKDESLGESTMSKYTLSGINLNGTFDTATGIAQATASETTEGGEAANTELTISAGFDSTSSVLLFPQTLTNNGITVSVSIDGNIYKATLELPSNATALEAGNNYAYTIKVTKVGIVINDASISAWTPTQGGSADATI